jgi:hypothetical protein
VASEFAVLCYEAAGVAGLMAAIMGMGLAGGCGE